MKVMTYDQKADIYLRALEQTGSVAQALQAADRAMFGAGRRKLTDDKLSQLRQRRAAGADPKDLAKDFDVTPAWVRKLVRDVRPARAARALSPVGVEVVRVVGELFTLPPGWDRLRRRGRPPGSIGLAQRAAMTAMRGEGLTNLQIGDIMGGRSACAVAHILSGAREDISVRQLATLAREILARAVPSTASALPPLSAPAGAAA